MGKTRRAGRGVTARKKPVKPTRRRMVSLIVRLPPNAIARLRAVAAVRKLSTGRVLAVALRLYERHVHQILR